MSGRGPAKVAPGPILALALESLRRIARHFEAFIRLALVPAAASFLLELLLFSTSAAELFDPVSPRAPTVGDLGILVPTLLLNFAPVSLFAVAWTRVVLLQPAAEPGLLLRWGSRELAYFLRLIPLVGATVGIVLLPTFMFGSSSPAEGLLTIVAVLVAVLLFARAMLVLPAAALGLRFGLADAMAVTRGAVPVWNLLAMAIIYLPFLPFFLLVAGLLQASGLVQAAPYASLFIQVAIGYAMQAGAVGLQALLFRHLTGWRPSAPAPVSA